MLDHTKYAHDAVAPEKMRALLGSAGFLSSKQELAVFINLMKPDVNDMFYKRFDAKLVLD